MQARLPGGAAPSYQGKFMSTPNHADAAAAVPPASAPSTLAAFIMRLHFYAGLFAAPFILVAAITGVLYVLTPQIENRLYADALYTAPGAVPRPLVEQIAVARGAVAADARVFAVRPAPGPDRTTRVMFSQQGLGEGEHRAIFIDPATLEIKGDLAVYGTSGTLPFRTALVHLHRDLMLGDVGRNYSELAASWLWFTALGGVILWVRRRRQQPAAVPARAVTRAAAGAATAAATGEAGAASGAGGVAAAAAARGSRRDRLRRWHGMLGVWIAIGLFFLSATGLTWSRWAGERIDAARAQWGWVTPALSTDLRPGATADASGDHADHGHMTMTAAVPEPDPVPVPVAAAASPASASAESSALAASAPIPPAPSARWGADATEAMPFDGVLHAARAAGIDAGEIEIRAPRKPDQAWVVREVDRAWPTQVDAVAIDGRDMAVVSRADFAGFPLVAKLIRWGIDAHMGILFGVMNQLIMAACGIALSVMIVLGYAMWWRRRPQAGAGVLTVTRAWRQLPRAQRWTAVTIAALLGWCLPLMGLSLLVFMLVDVLRWQLARRRPPRALARA